MQNHYFLAIPIPRLLQLRISQALQERWTSTAFKKWVHPSDYHLTSVFLGNVPITTLHNIVEELKQSLLTTSRFRLILSEPNIFGVRERPRIYWLGIEPNEQLMRLQSHIKQIVESHGVKVESRAYSPHITLARSWRMDEAFQNVSLSLKGEELEVDEVVVYQTMPDREPKYQTIHQLTLGCN